MGSSHAYSYINNTVIYVHNVGMLTADDFRKVDDEIIALMNKARANGAQSINVMVDCTEMSGLPHITSLEGGRILKYLKEPNCGWTMIVGYKSNPFLVVLSRFLTSIMGAELRLADDLELAQRQIKRMFPDRQDIPDIMAWRAQNLPEASDE